MKEKTTGNKAEKKITGWSYMELALTAFAGLGIEVLYAFLIEPFLYGVPMQEWVAWQTILHWILTCITWGLVAWYIVRTTNKKYGFDILKKGEKMSVWQKGLAIFAIVFSITITYIDWNGFKVIGEFQRKGLLLFSFQYLYYMFETVLFMLIIIFGQKAFEVWFGHKNIPYGGIVCGLTWGLAHAFTKGDLTSGLMGILWGFMMGSAYLLTNRDSKKAYVILFFMFAF